MNHHFAALVWPADISVMKNGNPKNVTNIHSTELTKSTNCVEETLIFITTAKCYKVNRNMLKRMREYSLYIEIE